MAASAGHAVAFTIGPIFKHVTLIFDGIPQITVQRYQIAAPRWPNDIRSAADNAIFKNRAQNIDCSFRCVAPSTVQLKPNVANILLFNFCEQHCPITIATASPCSFSKKNGIIMPLDQNPPQTETRFGCL